MNKEKLIQELKLFEMKSFSYTQETHEQFVAGLVDLITQADSPYLRGWLLGVVMTISALELDLKLILPMLFIVLERT